MNNVIFSVESKSIDSDLCPGEPDAKMLIDGLAEAAHDRLLARLRSLLAANLGPFTRDQAYDDQG